ncbi:MAG: TatD family hydrolase [Oscillospiraceae bacterium]
MWISTARWRPIPGQGHREIGLDYHYDFSPAGHPEKVFAEQMALARALSLPVVIHEREALPDTLEILKRYPGDGVVHCFRQRGNGPRDPATGLSHQVRRR